MRVGLIALSGVRVANEELAAAGLTLPGFVSRGEVIASLPSLALTTLAAHTPDDVEVSYLEVADLAHADAVPADFDLVGLSSYTAQAYDMYALADRLRAAGVAVVIGGLHASALPDEAAAHADAVCAGEGEPLWPRILEDFRAGGRAGLLPIYREDAPGTWDLAGSRMPRFDLLLGRPYNRITVQTTRGCPLDCEFCGASKLYGRGYRHKPPALVVEEMSKIRELWGDRAFVELADDNSFGRPRRARELLKAMKGLGLRWFTETDVSIADHPDLLDLLREAGCAQVLIGFESLNPANLDGLDRANWKLKRRAGYAEAIARIQGHGVSVNGCFVLGHDGDEEGVFEEVHGFIEDNRLLEAQLTVLTPFPGTRLLDRLRREGRLLYDRFWDRCTLFDVVYRPRGMSVERLERGLLELMREVYGQAALRRRKRHYVELMKDLL